MLDYRGSKRSSSWLPADTEAEAERLEAAVVVPEQDSTSACCGKGLDATVNTPRKFFNLAPDILTVFQGMIMNKLFPTYCPRHIMIR